MGHFTAKRIPRGRTFLCPPALQNGFLGAAECAALILMSPSTTTDAADSAAPRNPPLNVRHSPGRIFMESRSELHDILDALNAYNDFGTWVPNPCGVVPAADTLEALGRQEDGAKKQEAWRGVERVVAHLDKVEG